MGIEIIKTKEVEESGIKYLNINVVKSEVERNPNIVRLCSDVGMLEYVKPKTGHWIYHEEKRFISAEHWECSWCHRATMTNPFSADGNDYDAMYYCPKCGAKMIDKEKEEKAASAELAHITEIQLDKAFPLEESICGGLENDFYLGGYIE